MTDKTITIEELAKFMQQQLPMTFDIFEKHRDEDDAPNAAKWARGRIDAYLQIMQIIDGDREALLRADWERVVTGKGFMSDED